jgi:hypothetical protein
MWLTDSRYIHPRRTNHMALPLLLRVRHPCHYRLANRPSIRGMHDELPTEVSVLTHGICHDIAVISLSLSRLPNTAITTTKTTTARLTILHTREFRRLKTVEEMSKKVEIRMIEKLFIKIVLDGWVIFHEKEYPHALAAWQST